MMLGLQQGEHNTMVGLQDGEHNVTGGYKIVNTTWGIQHDVRATQHDGRATIQ